MTVKVLSRKPAKEVRKRITCRGCGARLEYVPNDVQTRSGTDYGGGPDGAEYIICPDCQSRVTIRSW